MTNPAPFQISVPDDELKRIRRRVAEYEWFEEPVDADPAGPWPYGCDGTYLRELCAYWLDGFDWRAVERDMQTFPHFKAPVEGPDGVIDIHFIHAAGSNPDNLPVIILHGWPGTFVEYLEVIEPLAHPERFGGDAADGRDIIVPSLIGYGFSGKPSRPFGPRTQAHYMNGLMTQALGFEHYIAQGGDWGGIITNWLGFDHGEPTGGPVKAIHANLIGVRPTTEDGPVPMETDEEKAWELEVFNRYQARESGYFQVQSTRPQSLAYGMMDSPVGIAAWLTEKFHAWSDLSEKGEAGGTLDGPYTKDQLLANIMVYITSRTFNTSTWQYWGAVMDGDFAFPPGARCETPTGLAAYPREIVPLPPRSFAEKGYNVVSYNAQPKGGHFAAMEQPEIFVQELQAFLHAWG